MARKVIIGRKEKNKVNTGGVSVGTSVVALSANDRELKGGVQIVADAGNSGVVYVGVRATLTAGSANATDGFPLSAGDTVFLPVSKESEVQLIGSASGQSAHFISY